MQSDSDLFAGRTRKVNREINRTCAFSGIAFSPDGLRLVTGSRDGSVARLCCLPAPFPFVQTQTPLGRLPGQIKMIPVDLPVFRFLPVAHVLFPEQVVAGRRIVRDCRVIWTFGVPALLDGHLDVDRTQVGVGDGEQC